jgi:phosphatidylglycerol lysyltransferase
LLASGVIDISQAGHLTKVSGMTGIVPLSESDRRAQRLVRAHGRAATCWQILLPELSRWFSGAGDGVIGFATYRRTRVVAGEPVCPLDRLTAICRDFEQDAARVGERVCYLAAEDRLVKQLGRDGRHPALPIGAQPVWSPAALARRFQKDAALRYQVNRARNKGIDVVAWPPERFDDPALQRCLLSWLAGKPLPPLGFMTDPYLLARMDGRLLLVAKGEAGPAGYAVLSPVPARQGWLAEQIVRCTGAPNGTAESLVAAAAQYTSALGGRFLTLGASPLSRRGERLSRRHPLWLRGGMGWLRAHGSRFYNFRGLEHFKAKFRPEAWEPVYVVVADHRFRPSTLYAVMGVFTKRSPLLAGLQALVAGVAVEMKRFGRWLAG